MTLKWAITFSFCNLGLASNGSKNVDEREKHCKIDISNMILFLFTKKENKTVFYFSIFRPDSGDLEDPVSSDVNSSLRAIL